MLTGLECIDGYLTMPKITSSENDCVDIFPIKQFTIIFRGEEVAIYLFHPGKSALIEITGTTYLDSGNFQLILYRYFLDTATDNSDSPLSVEEYRMDIGSSCFS